MDFLKGQLPKAYKLAFLNEKNVESKKTRESEKAKTKMK
jgi:hypothetical protein